MPATNTKEKGVINMEEADIKNLLDELKKVREQLGAIKYPGPEITSSSSFETYFQEAKDNLWECIKCINVKLTGDVWWGTEYQEGKEPSNVDLSDDGETMATSCWGGAGPDCISMPGGAWLSAT